MRGDATMIVLRVKVGGHVDLVSSFLRNEQFLDRSKTFRRADARLRCKARSVVYKNILRAIMHSQAVGDEMCRIAFGKVEDGARSNEIERSKLIGKCVVITRNRAV